MTISTKDSLTVPNIFNRPQQKQQWRVDQFLEIGGYSIIIGEKGAGKTTFACGHIIPEAFRAGIQRVVFVTTNSETTVQDLILYARTYGYTDNEVLHFGTNYSQRSITEERVSNDAPESAGLLRRVAADEAGEHYLYNQRVFYADNIIWLLKCLADDAIPTLWVAEGLPDMLPNIRMDRVPQDIVKYGDLYPVYEDLRDFPDDWAWGRYSGGDVLQNTEQKKAVGRILAVMGVKDSFLELTHTQKAKPDQIKGSTGRYDTARIAHFINKHQEGGVRWTTIRGDGNANISVSFDRKLLVEPTPEADLVAVFGADYKGKMRVPEQRFIGIEDKKPDARRDLELLLDMSYPVSTHDLLVALDQKDDDDDTRNDARDWTKLRQRFERMGITFDAKRGKTGNMWTLTSEGTVARLVGRDVPKKPEGLSTEEAYIWDDEVSA
jgi:hypothetical protein